MKYTSVDVASKKVPVSGHGSQLAKFDVESAYRTVPVHPKHKWLLGMRYRNQLYIDKVLPFGWSKNYSVVANGLQWILRESGVVVIHYLDNFLVAGRPSLEQCKQSLEKSLALCAKLRVPVAAHKTEGPASCQVFLGIELDTQLMARLPDNKLRRLQEEIRKWEARKVVCMTRELLSFIGERQHACCVGKPGGSFLRMMIDLARGVQVLHHKTEGPAMVGMLPTSLEW